MSTNLSSDRWRLPDLIDLGDLRARYAVALPLTIQTPGPARLSSDLSGLTIFPTQTNGGEQLLQVSVAGDHLFKETLLTGQLTIQTASETRKLWIIGRVLDDEFQQWTRENLQLTAPSKRRFLSRAGIVLGKHSLAGEPGAEQISDCQAYLHKEESGVWTLFQPRPSSMPLVVNGDSLAVGQRRIIIGGETIALGKLIMQVETYSTNLALLVDGLVDFGRLSAHSRAQLTIKNRSSHPWLGTLKAMVPWIVVPNPMVNCPGRQSVNLDLQLGHGIPDVSGQQLNLTSALLLEGQQEVWSIGARLWVDAKLAESLALQAARPQLDHMAVAPPATPAPHLTTGAITLLSSSSPVSVLSIDLGTVSHTAVEAATHQIHFTNPLPQIISGRAWVNDYFWLEVTPSTFICPPGQTVPFTVKLNKLGADLRPKRYTVEDAILIEYNGQQTRVTVTLAIQPPNHQASETASVSAMARTPEPALQTIDFGPVNHFGSPLPAHTFRLSNSSTQVMTGTVRVNDYFWLEITPTTFTCMPGQEVLFTVAFNSSVASLRPKQYHVADAILVESSGQRQYIAVAMTIVRPTSS